MMSVDVPKLGPSQSASIYMMGLILVVAALLIAYLVYASKFGAGLFAIHDDEDAAEVMGVPTYRYKLLALAISCGLAGLAGGVHAIFVSYITVSETFSITVPLSVVLMSILGGSRHWIGPAIGAVAITGLQFFFTAGNSAVLGRAIFGFILVVVILFLPEGVMGLGAQVARRVREKLGGAKQSAAADAHAPMVAPAQPRAAPVIGAPLLRVTQLSKSFKGVRALNDVTLEVRQGEILGLIGPNGSGKSTFINMVSGHYRTEQGRIEFDGRDLSCRDAHEFAGAGIARTYQIPRPFAHKTVLENVAISAMFGGKGLSRADALRESETYLAFAGLSAKRDSLPDDLNLHQRKFLELARALAAQPKLLLLDEVLSGLTPAEINGAIEMIRRIRDRGTTIVFVEHVMRAVMALTDRIVVLNHGKLIAEGLPRDVMDAADVKAAYLGKAHA
jgi:branched-chain amino acid transport system permease protein